MATPSPSPSPSVDQVAGQKRIRPLVLDLKPLAARLRELDDPRIGTARLPRPSRAWWDLGDSSSTLVGLGNRTVMVSAKVDDEAPFAAQRYCDPTPKPGAVALGEILLDAVPGTVNMGVTRPCDQGDRSEHKEGRAFDWGVVGVDPAKVDAVVAQLLAPDKRGNAHAMARRLGIMYIIWNGEIWSGQFADRGWRPYNGHSEHVDHVHFSLSWPGALGHTSFWQVGADEGWVHPMPSVREVLAGLTIWVPPTDEPSESETPSPSESPTPTPPPTTSPKAPTTTPSTSTPRPSKSPTPTTPPPPPPPEPTPTTPPPDP
ncbi:MAG TPA: hypothetical protein VJ978_05030, partial [Nitriliruptoraceae bacterium]|nr:hypothetical protein [Nitriliruptoraceae bacterium]